MFIYLVRVASIESKHFLISSRFERTHPPGASTGDTPRRNRPSVRPESSVFFYGNQHIQRFTKRATSAKLLSHQGGQDTSLAKHKEVAPRAYTDTPARANQDTTTCVGRPGPLSHNVSEWPLNTAMEYVPSSLARSPNALLARPLPSHEIGAGDVHVLAGPLVAGLALRSLPEPEQNRAQRRL